MDLVARIRARPHDAPMPTEHLLDDAAEEIERLERDKAKLLDILKETTCATYDQTVKECLDTKDCCCAIEDLAK